MSTAVRLVPEATNLPVPMAEAYGRAMEEVSNLLRSPEVQSRFAQVLLTELRTKHALHACSPQSIVLAVVQMAAHGLDPSVTNECHLIPYTQYDQQGRRTGVEAQLQIGYGGLVKLALAHPDVRDVWAEEVCANDGYQYHGLDQRPTHAYPGKFLPRGPYIGYYAVALLAGDRVRCLQMSVEEMKQHARHYSRNSDKKIWSEASGGGFRGMAIKTMLRRICDAKYIPLAGRVQELLQHLDRVDTATLTPMDTPYVSLGEREPDKTTQDHMADLAGDPPPPARGPGQAQEAPISAPTEPVAEPEAETPPVETPAPPDVPTEPAASPESPPEATRALRARIESLQVDLGWTTHQCMAWRGKQVKRFQAKDFARLSREVLQGLYDELTQTPRTRRPLEEPPEPEPTPDPEPWRTTCHLLATNTQHSGEMLDGMMHADLIQEVSTIVRIALRMCEDPAITEKDLGEVTTALRTVGSRVAAALGMAE